MSDPKRFILAHDEARRRAMSAVADAPAGWVIRVEPPKRTLSQNDKFHAICTELAMARVSFMGKPRSADVWKVLLISGHAKVTGEGSEVVPGLEGEFVNIRESSARMPKERASSLIEYATAFAAMQMETA